MGYLEHTKKISFLEVGESNKLSTQGFIKFMEEVAGAHSSMVGYGLNDIERTDLTWILLNWKVRIFNRPIWNSNITIKTWPRSVEKFYSYRDFEVYDENRNLICIASSKWLLMTASTKSISRISEKMEKDYDCINISVFDEPINDKLVEYKDQEFIYNYRIQRRDIDTNHHVNNLYYLDFAYEALPDDIYNLELNNIEIQYKKEITYKSVISCFYSNVDNEHTVTIKSEDGKTTHAIIRFAE